MLWSASPCQSMAAGVPRFTGLDMYGSAARGDLAYECGNTLGKILRTIYLCDLLSNPRFRGKLQSVLNQGESMHELQRAIHNGPSRARHGRSREELTAISGALSDLIESAAEPGAMRA